METGKNPDKPISHLLVKRNLLLVGVIGLVFLAGFIFRFLHSGSTQVSSEVLNANEVITIQPQQVVYGLPTRLVMPNIAVDAQVESVGLTKGGAMDVPKNQDNVAWYNRGQRPGEIGTAVIAGHYGVWDNGKGSVFDRLSQLQIGDSVEITDEQGKNTVFVVHKIQTFDAQADTKEVFTSSDGQAHLNLITCQGKWNPVTQSYPKRLVIFTDKA